MYHISHMLQMRKRRCREWSIMLICGIVGGGTESYASLSCYYPDFLIPSKMFAHKTKTSPHSPYIPHFVATCNFLRWFVEININFSLLSNCINTNSNELFRKENAIKSVFHIFQNKTQSKAKHRCGPVKSYGLVSWVQVWNSGAHGYLISAQPLLL